MAAPKATYTALLLAAQAMNTTAWASASSPSGLPAARRSRRPRAPARVRAGRRCRCPPRPCAARGVPRSAGRSRRRACGKASRVRRPVGAAHRLVQGRDLVVELLALLVEAAVAARGHLGRDRLGDHGSGARRLVAREVGRDLEKVQCAARVTVGARASVSSASGSSSSTVPRASASRANARRSTSRTSSRVSERSTYTRAGRAARR